MGLDVNISGLTALKESLMKLATSDATKAGQSAVRAGAKAALPSVKDQTPVSDVPDGKGHHKIISSLRVKKIKTDDPHKVGAAISVGKAWHAMFVEWGTIHQRPNGFMMRGAMDAKQQAIDAMAKQLQKQIIKRQVISDDV